MSRSGIYWLLPVVAAGLLGVVSVWQPAFLGMASAEDKPAKRTATVTTSVATTQATATATASAQSGSAKRPLWTTSKVKGSPEPPPRFRTQTAFPNLKFFEPLELRPVPGSNRLAIAERPGKIYTFENNGATKDRQLLVDTKKTTYGFCFHPQFEKNGYLYVTMVLDASKTEPEGSRLVRYQAKGPNKSEVDPASETVILTWPSGGHNGGCITFGKDGYLYLVTGDGSGIADELQTGQDISDLLASLLRIDVDKPAAGKNYGIPADNPFVSTAGARPEIYAYGLRQAWKISFDRATGDCWAGEVGQDLWEMVYKIEKGGNYGWSVKEGDHPFRPERKLGPSPILKPVYEHPHVDYRSITGGFVYRGSKFPALQGCYIYADYDTGKISALKYDGSKVTYYEELADTPLRIVAFGEDHAGELLLVDFIGGTMHQLVEAPPSTNNVADFPRKLSETGLFTSTKDLTPATGLIPYAVNSELWSDHAIKQRYLAIPGDGQIEFDGVVYPQPSPGAPRGWRFPDGTVAVKTFEMEMEKGNPASRKRLETRILHYEQTAGSDEVGDQVWKGYTYLWNDEQTDAILVEKQGADRELTVKDAAAPNGVRKQTWHFPSRNECTLCHTTPAKYVLGLNTRQLNRNYDYGNGTVENQIAHFQKLGLFTKPLPMSVPELPKLVNHHDSTQPLDARARSYLQSNCAHCHIKWGGGNAEFQLISTLDLKDTGTINVRANHGVFGVTDGKLLVPGDPLKSLIYVRMQKLGLGRMPHIASTVVDEPATKLIHDWIKSLPPATSE